MRHLSRLLLAATLLLAACGGFGDDDGDNPGPPRTPDSNATRTATRTRGPTRTPGGPTDTPRPTNTPGPPRTLFVRQSGNDSNPGTSPDQALRTLREAITLLTPGSTIFVGRGVYTGRLVITDVEGSEDQPVRIIADREGAQTGDPDGDVILDADGDLVGVILTRSPFVTLDGFILRGVEPTEEATAVNYRARGGSDHAEIRNCVIANSAVADGIRVDSSNDVRVFNNLVFAADRGVIVTGASTGTQVINNTIALTVRAGLALRGAGGIEPSATRVVNNIIQEAGSVAALDASGGLDGFAGDYNLVFQPGSEDQTTSYTPPTARGEHDRNSDAFFVNLEVGDARLLSDSPAIDAGTDDIDEALADELLDRTTQEDGGLDRPPIDMGYHYPR